MGDITDPRIRNFLVDFTEEELKNFPPTQLICGNEGTRREPFSFTAMGSIRSRLAPRAYDAPPCGPSVRVVPDRLTESRKIPTRTILPLFFVHATHLRQRRPADPRRPRDAPALPRRRRRRRLPVPRVRVFFSLSGVFPPFFLRDFSIGSVQQRVDGGHVGFVWWSGAARASHVGPRHVWCPTLPRKLPSLLVNLARNPNPYEGTRRTTRLSGSLSSG